MNSRSLYLHAKRVMAAVENAINSLDDGEVLTESLTSLGQRHQAWSVTEDHFAVNYQFRETVKMCAIRLSVLNRRTGEILSKEETNCLKLARTH